GGRPLATTAKSPLILFDHLTILVLEHRYDSVVGCNGTERLPAKRHRQRATRADVASLHSVSKEPHLSTERRVAGLIERALQHSARRVKVSILTQVDGAVFAVTALIDLDGHVLIVNPVGKATEAAQAITKEKERAHVVRLGGVDDGAGVERARADTDHRCI